MFPQKKDQNAQFFTTQHAALSAPLLEIILPSLSQEQVKTYAIPDEYRCPITYRIMSDPVTAADGETYECEAITEWLVAHNTSPMHGDKLAHKNLNPNLLIKRIIDSLLSKNPELAASEEVYLAKNLAQSLVTAFKENNTAEVRRILAREQRLIISKFKNGTSILTLAANSCLENFSLVCHLMGERLWQMPEISDKNGAKKLFINVASNNGVAGAKFVIEKLCWKISDIQMALFEAMERNDLLIVKICLELGVNINNCYNDVVPLRYAVHINNVTLIEFLLKHGADPNSVAHFVLSQPVTTPNFQQLIDIFLQVGVNLEVLDHEQNTLLLKVIKLNNQPLAQVLIARKANLNAQDANGDTALHITVRNNNNELAICLLTFGIDGKILNRQHLTAEQLAIQLKQLEFAQIIINKRRELKMAPLLDPLRHEIANKTEELHTKNVELQTLRQQMAQALTEQRKQLVDLNSARRTRNKAIESSSSFNHVLQQLSLNPGLKTIILKKTAIATTAQDPQSLFSKSDNFCQLIANGNSFTIIIWRSQNIYWFNTDGITYSDRGDGIYVAQKASSFKSIAGKKPQQYVPNTNGRLSYSCDNKDDLRYSRTSEERSYTEYEVEIYLDAQLFLRLIWKTNQRTTVGKAWLYDKPILLSTNNVALFNQTDKTIEIFAGGSKVIKKINVDECSMLFALTNNRFITGYTNGNSTCFSIYNATTGNCEKSNLKIELYCNSLLEIAHGILIIVGTIFGNKAYTYRRELIALNPHDGSVKTICNDNAVPHIIKIDPVLGMLIVRTHYESTESIKVLDPSMDFTCIATLNVTAQKGGRPSDWSLEPMANSKVVFILNDVIQIWDWGKSLISAANLNIAFRKLLQLKIITFESKENQVILNASINYPHPLEIKSAFLDCQKFIRKIITQQYLCANYNVNQLAFHSADSQILDNIVRLLNALATPDPTLECYINDTNSDKAKQP